MVFRKSCRTNKRKIMNFRKTYETELCECGHTAPVEFVTHDEDGNGTCPTCQIEFMHDVISGYKSIRKTESEDFKAVMDFAN